LNIELRRKCEPCHRDTCVAFLSHSHRRYCKGEKRKNKRINTPIAKWIFVLDLPSFKVLERAIDHPIWSRIPLSLIICLEGRK